MPRAPGHTKAAYLARHVVGGVRQPTPNPSRARWVPKAIHSGTG